MDRYFFHSSIVINRVARSIALAGLGAYGVVSLAHAQSESGDISQRAASRLESNMQSAMILLNEGRTAYKKGEYKTALDKYRESLATLPNSPNMEKRRQFIQNSIGDASIAVAQDYIKVGRYDEAKGLLNDAIKLSTNKALAQQVLAYMEDPIRTNPAQTPENVKDVEEVNNLLQLAYGFYQLGQYDDAILNFNKVLAIDPYNTAARNGMQNVNKAKASYYRSARDEARSSALAEVDKSWERTGLIPIDEIEQVDSAPPADENWFVVENKLEKTMIPHVNFQGVTLAEAIDFIRSASRTYDTLSPIEADKGINITLDVGNVNESDPSSLLNKTFNLKLENVSLQQLLNTVAQLTGTNVRVNAYGVELTSTKGASDYMVTRNIKLPIGFFNGLSASLGDNSSSEENPWADTPNNAMALKAVQPMKILKKLGLKLPDGSYITLRKNDSSLMFHGPASDWQLLEDLVSNQQKTQPLQVVVTTTMVEVDQEELKELGFDWLVNFTDPTKLYWGGGTTETSPPNLGGTKIANGSVGSTRSSSSAFSGDTIDSVLKYGTANAQTKKHAPTFFAFQGSWANSQVTLLMRGLDQKTGADIMQRPSVVVKPGQKAVFYSGRDFIYPQAYDAPQIPTSSSANSGGGTPIAPANPNDFVTKQVGTIYEVEVTGISEDKQVVDLNVIPQIVDFEGFVNYGSPIMMPVVARTNNSLASDLGLENKLGITMMEITKNEILQPVFNRKELSTNVTIATGHTVVLGGLKKAQTTVFEDKIPIMGDLPLVGRLFRSEGKETKRKAFIVLIKADIIDPAGKGLMADRSSGEVFDSIEHATNTGDTTEAEASEEEPIEEF